MMFWQSPAVSVIMPVRNAEAHLRDAISSILSQDLKSIELIILEDGSNDGSLSIAKKFNDRRVRIFSDGTARGIAYRLNQGLDAARSDYVARMDADDVSLPARLSTQLSYMKQNQQIGICGTNFYRFDGDGNRAYVTMPLSSYGCRVKLPFATPVAHPTVMFNKKLLDRFQLRYDPDCIAEDYDLWVRASQFFDIGNVGVVLLGYRSHDKQVTRAKERDIWESANQSRRVALNNIRIPYNEAEFKLHSSIASQHNLPEVETVETARDWLSKIAFNKWQTVDEALYMRRECQFYLDCVTDLAKKSRIELRS